MMTAERWAEDRWWREFWRTGDVRFADQVWTWYARAGAAAARAVAAVTDPVMGHRMTTWLIEEVKARAAHDGTEALIDELRGRGCGEVSSWPIIVEAMSDRFSITVGGEDSPERRAITAGLAVALGLGVKFDEDGAMLIGGPR